MDATSKLLSPVVLSRRLNLPAAWLKEEAKQGRLPHLRIGRQIRFNQEAVQRVLADRASAIPEHEGTVALAS